MSSIAETKLVYAKRLLPYKTMWISRLELLNIRSFVDQHEVVFAKNINIIVGQNNSGKSTILNTILSTQVPNILNPSDITLNRHEGRFSLYFKERETAPNNPEFSSIRNGFVQFVQNYDRPNNGNNRSLIRPQDQGSSGFKHFPQTEPDNLIYPYLSKRKVASFSEQVNSDTTNSVTGNHSNLVAKILRLSNVSNPQNKEYIEHCNNILGFPVTHTPSPNGHKPAYIIDSFEHILLSSMGEGVANLLGLIVDLCISKGKIFLIEEPENDIHPKALKALLELIANKSKDNQFFISTHSNIVTKYLGAVEDSRIFRVSMSLNEKTRLPISTVNLVENEPNARLRLLEELGYEPFDFGQWKAWLILEESSAECIIRDFLIPRFVPKLKDKLRTYSAGGKDEIEPRFNDFKNLFVFIHLEELYKNKAWVVIDSGEEETKIIERMKETFSKSGWDEDNFLQLTKHDFEEYYPDRFSQEVNAVLTLKDKKTKRDRKKGLLLTVKSWVEANPEDAKKEFNESAKDVIEILKKISKKVG